MLGTILGATHLIEQSGIEPAELRRRVTSPGGTTAEAIRVFDEAQLTQIVRKAVAAALARAKELGKTQ